MARNVVFESINNGTTERHYDDGTIEHLYSDGSVLITDENNKHTKPKKTKLTKTISSL